MAVGIVMIVIGEIKCAPVMSWPEFTELSPASLVCGL